jgi:chemotaxis protein methyltransferase CheR
MIEPVDYRRVRERLLTLTGVELGDSRQTMVESRLRNRVEKLNFQSFSSYLSFVFSGEPNAQSELQALIDCLTTHETYFYREAQHFNFLRQRVLPHFKDRPLRILSAACSSGEEVYTLAFECMAALGGRADWNIDGVDIAENVLSAAREGLYDERRSRLIPEEMKSKFMRKGINKMAGYCLVNKEIKEHASFAKDNILETRPGQAKYDVIFCRNVLIYFDPPTKKKAIDNLYDRLNPGGYLFVSRSEQLRQLLPCKLLINPNIARKPLPKDNE